MFLMLQNISVTSDQFKASLLIKINPFLYCFISIYVKFSLLNYVSATITSNYLYLLIISLCMYMKILQ